MYYLRFNIKAIINNKYYLYYRNSLKIILVAIISAIIISPIVIGEPAANPLDPAKEDLSRIYYPSQANIAWSKHFIKPEDSIEVIFGSSWPIVARFNRIDRRHLYPGMTIKVPINLDNAKYYSPVPKIYEPAKRHYKYVLISLNEQWLGAYEYGYLKFSVPAATGTDENQTPTGIFRVSARHRHHTSSLYQTEDKAAQYPMDNAIRFHVGADNISYWIHSRDLPGRPASHGCVGLYDEKMQSRVYGIPDEPVLLDSQKLYSWAVGEPDYEEDSGEFEEIEDGPIVEIIGKNPIYKQDFSFSKIIRR